MAEESAENIVTQVVRRSGLQTMNFEEATRLADDLTRSAITTLKQPISIPKTEGVDLTSAQSEVERARATRDETAETIDQERVRLGQAAEDQKEAIGEAGRAESDKILADQANLQIIADLQKAYAEMFGISLDPNADMAIAAQKMRQLKPGAEEKLRRIQELQSVGFLDNPLEWLANQIQLPAAIGDYNSEAQIINSLQNSIDASIKAGQDAANFAQKGVATISAASAKAEADKIVAKAAENKAIADSNLARNSVTFAVQQLSNDITIANADKSMSQLEMANENARYQSLINEINLADNHATRLLKAAQLIEKLQDTEGMKVIFERYDRTMGHPIGTTNKYIFEKFPQAQRENIVAIGAGSIGSGPLEGATNWRLSRPGPGASKETMTFMNYLNDHIDLISQDTRISALDTKLQPNAINKRLKQQIEMDINGASRMGNIFYEMTPASMIASKAIPADSQLAKVLEPFTKQTGQIPTEVILEAINNEWKNPAEAGAVIADYYTRNIHLRNSVMNTSLVGIQLPKNYKIGKSTIMGPEQQPSALTSFGGLKITFDLTRPEEATKYILLSRAAKTTSMFEGFVNPQFPEGAQSIGRNVGYRR